MDILSGRMLTADGFVDGYVILDDGRVTEIGEGRSPESPTAEGLIVPGIVDAHTHVADAGLRLTKRYSLEELVAPPNGLKHRYLSSTSHEKLLADMRGYSNELVQSGASRFLDFRENGFDGCRMLRQASDRAIILGRPVSDEFDAEEIDRILDVADGIGISSITDMDRGYIAAVADRVHRRGKLLALHVSERIREDIGFVLSLEPSFVVHMAQATDGDMRACAEADVPVAVCATSNLYFGIVPPIARMLRAGMSVGIGTDNAMLCRPDILAEAEAFSKVLAAQGGTVDQSIACAFKGGWKILYQESNMKVQTGMEADLVVIPRPENDPFSGPHIGIRRFGPQGAKKDAVQEHPRADRW
jgi:cytosine/adenosine deaminase-related metal-dependent hydrolase